MIRNHNSIKNKNIIIFFVCPVTKKILGKWQGKMQKHAKRLQKFSNVRSLSCWFTNWLPYKEGRERLRKEVALQTGGGRFNKQRSLHTRLVLDSSKTTRSPHSPARILKVHIEALAVFSHVCCPDALNNTLLSQVCVLGTAPTVGTEGRVYIPRMERGWGASNCPGPALRPISNHILSVTSSNIRQSPSIWTTDLLSPLGWGSDHSGCSLVSSCDLIEMVLLQTHQVWTLNTLFG